VKKTLPEASAAAYGGFMAAVGRVRRPLQVVMCALGWASVAGLLCLWLTTSAASYDGSTSKQTSVVTQASTSVLLPARQHVDLAMILPTPVWIDLGQSLSVVSPMVLLVLVLRRPVNRHTPRAPPVASVT
jgi:hypothetical protein